MLAKLPGLSADAVLVDLEDGVAPAEKERARGELRKAAADWPSGTGPPWMLRVNPPSTPWHAAARIHRCEAIDSVFFHFRDLEGLGEHARIARELGYDGKSCIHPMQIDPIHEIFSSTEDELAWARAVREAWVAQDGATRGVVVSNGEMIEALHVELAERILARAPR
jgi:citrate lyase beta subunit